MTRMPDLRRNVEMNIGVLLTIDLKILFITISICI